MYNKQSLTEHFLEHRQSLLGYVTGLLYCPNEAEDVVQDTWLRLMQSDTHEPVSFPKAYIFRIGRNIALDRLRGRKRAKNAVTLMSEEPGMAWSEAGPETHLIEEEQLQLLRDAVSNLPSRCQQVYALRSCQGLSHHAIAGQLDISVRTVENHIARATRNCRQYLAACRAMDKDYAA